MQRLIPQQTNLSATMSSPKPLSDSDRLHYLLAEIENAANRPHFYDDYCPAEDGNFDDAFDHGIKYGEILYAESLLTGLKKQTEKWSPDSVGTNWQELCAGLFDELQKLRMAVANELGSSSPESVIMSQARTELAKSKPQREAE
jgi:hypothetical protein